MTVEAPFIITGLPESDLDRLASLAHNPPRATCAFAPLAATTPEAAVLAARTGESPYWGIADHRALPAIKQLVAAMKEFAGIDGKIAVVAIRRPSRDSAADLAGTSQADLAETIERDGDRWFAELRLLAHTAPILYLEIPFRHLDINLPEIIRHIQRGNPWN